MLRLIAIALLALPLVACLKREVNSYAYDGQKYVVVKTEALGNNGPPTHRLYQLEADGSWNRLSLSAFQKETGKTVQDIERNGRHIGKELSNRWGGGY